MRAIILVDSRSRPLGFALAQVYGYFAYLGSARAIGWGLSRGLRLALLDLLFGLGRVEETGHHIGIFYHSVSFGSAPLGIPEVERVVSLGAQVGQRKCILLTPPQAGHRHSSVTSFRALPAICLCLLLECDAFFFGTAFNMPSHISSSDGSDGRFNDIAGIGSESLGRSGSASGLMWTEAYLEAKTVGLESRERIDGAVRADSIALAMARPLDAAVAQCKAGAYGLVENARLWSMGVTTTSYLAGAQGVTLIVVKWWS